MQYQTRVHTLDITFYNQFKTLHQYLNLKMRVLLLSYCMLLLISHIECSAYTLKNCSLNQIFDATTLSCTDCPINMTSNPNQAIPTSCVCSKGNYSTSATSCQGIGVGTCFANQYYNVINDDGSFMTFSGSDVCVNCSDNAYPNQNGTACVSCPRNMKYSPTQKICVCANAGVLTERGCFTSAEIANSSNFGQANSKYYNLLKYLFPSCAYFSDMQSCSQIVNLCTYSTAYTPDSQDPQCKFLSSNPTLKAYHYLDTSTNAFYMAPSSFTKSQQLKFLLLSYLPTGNFVKEKALKLTDIMRCGMPTDNSASIKIGNNIQVTCSFDFDNLIAKVGTKTYQNFLYELYLQGADQKYYPVQVYLSQSKNPVKRFFLQDTFTSVTSVNVLTKLKFSVTLNSSSYLVSPKLQISYKQLSYLDGKVAPTSDKYQSITYTVKFVYNLSTFWGPFIGIFIAINVLVLLQALARTYIAYLNRQSILGFFFYLANFWSLWMFYFLIVISGYWFLFCKTTQNLFIFIPDTDKDFFYVAFYLIAGFMGLLRLIVVLYDKKQKLNYEVFLINWEKGKNSWRQIFIVNSLAQFYTYRTISFFWMLLCLLFFMVGLKWEDNAAEVTHTTISQVYSFNPKNRVFLYFMGCTVLLVIGIIFKILRRLSVIKWPYPFEDFVDYCNVASISFYFMKKRSAEAYYIHACLPDKAEVTYKQINDAIRKGQNKSRNIMKQHIFQDQQRMYIIYSSVQLEQKFNNMIKRNEDEQHQKLVKVSQKNIERKKLKPLSYREDFIQNRLKPFLRDIQRDRPTKTRQFIKRLFGIPQIDLREVSRPKNRSEVIFDENQDLVQQIFPNGNQFEQIHTLIIIFLMFILITANITASAFMTYFVDHYLINGWIERSCRKNLQAMTRVKEGFML